MKRKSNTVEISDGHVLRRWIILQEHNKVPVTKGPLRTDEQVTEMLNKLYDLYPTATCTVARIAYGNDLWVDCGKEWLWEEKNG